MTLEDWLADQKLSDAAFARRIGASKAAVGRWRRGGRIPSRRFMQAIIIETHARVRAEDFYASSSAEAA